MSDNNKGINSTLKSSDTEETLDIYFTRPIGYAWALFFNKFNVHPNVVTILSIILGAAAGVMFYYTDLWHNIAGVLLLMWANFYDSCDGQLARMTGKKTLWGRILDGFAGDVWFFSIYLAIILRLWNQNIPFTDTPWTFWILIVAAFSGFICHGRQCALADYYRNIHLFFLKGKQGSELDNFKQQREKFHALSWKTDLWQKAFLFFYGNYTHGQEKQTPQFQRFFAKLKQVYGDDIPQEFRDRFRAQSKPLMPFTNILTFNTRAIALYISCLIDMPYLYFLFEIIVMTSLYVYMRNLHENMCAKFYDEL